MIGVKKELFFILLTAILFVVPVLYKARNLIFRLDSDYDSALPIFYYVVDSIRTGKGFPLWNPYIGTGISIPGDPLSMVLNPLLTVPMVIFGVDQGLRIILFLVVAMSGISMLFFLKRLEVKGLVLLWGALLYQTSGALPANIAAGHVEKFLSYPLTPLFFMSVLFAPMKRISILIAALILTLNIFSGDFYAVWFLSIFFLGIKAYYVITKQEQWIRGSLDIIIVYALFGVMASVRLIPYLFEVYPRIERFGLIDPFAGSIPIFLSPLPFIMPFRVAFYDRPSVQRLFGFYFNWYEYYAFISPLPFIFLLKIKALLKRNIIILLLFLLCMGALYAALRYSYSPFYWLFHFIPAVRMFRVPQRIFVPMTTLVIALLALCAQRWRGKMMIAICVLSLGWTFLAGQQTMLLSFEWPRTQQASLVHALREKDKGNFFVASFICCIQTFLVEEHIPILNYYYGWRLKGAPDFESAPSLLKKIRPKYIIASKKLDFSQYFYEPIMENQKDVIWKTDQSTVYPSW